MPPTKKKFHKVDSARDVKIEQVKDLFKVKDLKDEDFKIDDDFIEGEQTFASQRWVEIQSIKKGKQAKNFAIEEFVGFDEDELFNLLQDEVYSFKWIDRPGSYQGIVIEDRWSSDRICAVSKTNNNELTAHEKRVKDAKANKSNKENNIDNSQVTLDCNNFLPLIEILFQNIFTGPKVSTEYSLKTYADLKESIINLGKDNPTSLEKITNKELPLKKSYKAVSKKLESFTKLLDSKNITEITKGFLTRKYIELIYNQLVGVVIYIKLPEGKDYIDSNSRNVFKNNLSELVKDFVRKNNKSFRNSNQKIISQISNIEINQINNAKNKLNHADKNPCIDPVISSVLTKSQFEYALAEKLTDDKIDQILFDAMKFDADLDQKFVNLIKKDYKNKTTLELKIQLKELYTQRYNENILAIDAIPNSKVLTSQQNSAFAVVEEMLFDILYLTQDAGGEIKKPDYWKRAKGSLSYDTSEGKSFFIEEVVIKGFYDAINEYKSEAKRDFAQYIIAPDKSQKPLEFLAKNKIRAMAEDFLSDCGNLDQINISEQDQAIINFIGTKYSDFVELKVPADIEKTISYLNNLESSSNEDINKIITSEIKRLKEYQDYYNNIRDEIVLFKGMTPEDQAKIAIQYRISQNNFDIIKVNLANTGRLEDLCVDRKSLYGKLVIIDEAHFIDEIDEKVQVLVDLGAKIILVGASRNEVREQSKKLNKQNKIEEFRRLREINAEINGLVIDDLIKDDIKEGRIDELAKEKTKCEIILDVNGYHPEFERDKIYDREIESLQKRSDLYSDNVGQLRKRRDKAENISRKLFEKRAPEVGLKDKFTQGDWHSSISDNIESKVVRSQNLLFDYGFNFGECSNVNDIKDIDAEIRKHAYKDPTKEYHIKTIDDNGKDCIRLFDPMSSKFKTVYPSARDLFLNEVRYGSRLHYDANDNEVNIDEVLKDYAINDPIQKYHIEDVDDEGKKTIRFFNKETDKIEIFFPDEREFLNKIDYGFKQKFDDEYNEFKQPKDSDRLYADNIVFSYVVIRGELKAYCVHLKDGKITKEIKDLVDLNEIKDILPLDSQQEVKAILEQDQQRYINTYKEALSNEKEYIRYDVINSENEHNTFYINVETGYKVKEEVKEEEKEKEKEYEWIKNDVYNLLQIRKSKPDILIVANYSTDSGQHKFIALEPKSDQVLVFKDVAEFKSLVSKYERNYGQRVCMLYDKYFVIGGDFLSFSSLTENSEKENSRYDKQNFFITEEKTLNLDYFKQGISRDRSNIKALKRVLFADDCLSEYVNEQAKYSIELWESEMDGTPDLKILEQMRGYFVSKILHNNSIMKDLRDEIKALSHKISKRLDVNRSDIDTIIEEHRIGIVKGEITIFKKEGEIRVITNNFRSKIETDQYSEYFEVIKKESEDQNSNDVDEYDYKFTGSLDYEFDSQFPCPLGSHDIEELENIKKLYRDLQSYIFYESVLAHIPNSGVDEEKKFELDNFSDKLLKPEDYSLSHDDILGVSQQGSSSRFIDISYIEKLSKIVLSQKTLYASRRDIIENAYEDKKNEHLSQLKQAQEAIEAKDTDAFFDTSASTDMNDSFSQVLQKLTQHSENKKKRRNNDLVNNDVSLLLEERLFQDQLSSISSLHDQNSQRTQFLEEENERLKSELKKSEELGKEAYAYYQMQLNETKRYKEDINQLDVLALNIPETVQIVKKDYNSLVEIIEDIRRRSINENSEMIRHPIFSFLESPKDLFDYIKNTKFSLSDLRNVTQDMNREFNELYKYITNYSKGEKNLYGYKDSNIKGKNNIRETIIERTEDNERNNIVRFDKQDNLLITPCKLIFSKENAKDDRYIGINFTKVHFLEDSNTSDKIFNHPNFKDVKFRNCIFDNINNFSTIADKESFKTLKILSSTFKDVDFSQMDAIMFTKILSKSNFDKNKTTNSFENCVPPRAVKDIEDIFPGSVVVEKVISREQEQDPPTRAGSPVSKQLQDSKALGITNTNSP